MAQQIQREEKNYDVQMLRTSCKTNIIKRKLTHFITSLQTTNDSLKQLPSTHFPRQSRASHTSIIEVHISVCDLIFMDVYMTATHVRISN